MYSSRPTQWYYFQANLNWCDGTFKQDLTYNLHNYNNFHWYDRVDLAVFPIFVTDLVYALTFQLQKDCLWQGVLTSSWSITASLAAFHPLQTEFETFIQIFCSTSGDFWVSLKRELLLCYALAEDLLSTAHALQRSINAAAAVSTAFTTEIVPIPTYAVDVILYLRKWLLPLLL